MSRYLVGLVLAVGLSLSGAASAQTSAVQAAAVPALQRNDYGDRQSWLCRPGLTGKDACDVDLTTTVIAADGKMTREQWTANRTAPIDCFYVYPTVSTDPGEHSDMHADPPS